MSNPVPKPVVTLLYSDGHTGRTYHLQIGGEVFFLLAGNGSSQKEETLAKEKARAILIAKGLNDNIKTSEFIWSAAGKQPVKERSKASYL